MPQQAPDDPREEIAPPGRRVLALTVDWLIASAISAGFFDYHPGWTLAVFALMTILMVGTVGSTIGHRLLGLVVVRASDGSRPTFLSAILRTAGVCLVIPAVVWDPDGVSLHDRWSGTRILRLSRP